jgi:hypothetical protein
MKKKVEPALSPILKSVLDLLAALAVLASAILKYT